MNKQNNLWVVGLLAVAAVFPVSGIARNENSELQLAKAAISAEQALATDTAKPLFADGLKLKLTLDGSQYLQLTMLNQTWARWSEFNKGTTRLGDPVSQGTDLGLRRTRFQLFGMVSKHAFVYFQLGQNNFDAYTNNGSNRKQAFFIHDALTEYRMGKGGAFKIGGGLTICNGLSRFSQPSIGTIMTLDVPVFAQATVDQTDLFSRKLSLYHKGELGKLDYRFTITDPFPITSAGITVPAISKNAQFSPLKHHKQYQALLIYNFFEKEPTNTPYMPGTYWGKKKIWNIAVGGIRQNAATWSYTQTGSVKDTVFHPMTLLCVESFLDMPVSSKGDAVSAYAGYFSTNYGTNYLRYNGIMNPATGTTTGALAGDVGAQYGNAVPMFGTGSVIYSQLGYLLPKKTLGDQGQLHVYASYTHCKYDRLGDNALNHYSAGVNWLMPGNKSKLTLGYSNLSSVLLYNNGDFLSSRKSSVILQFQIFI